MGAPLISAVDTLQALAPAIARAKALGAILPVDLGAHSQALASDERRAAGKAGALEGMTISIKDNVALNGAPTTGANRSLVDYCPEEGLAVSRLRAAGAVFTAKTNLHELAFGITGSNSFTGPVLNPFDPSRLAGGSSSGAAVAVALGACIAAVGTDTGGSCRVPAAHCGVIGFRPTTGRYAANGYLTLSPSRDTLGLIARTVSDIAQIDGVITDDATPLPKLEIGSTIFGVVRVNPIDPHVAAAFETVLEHIVKSGAQLVEVDLCEAIAVDEACGFTIALYETAQSIIALARDACAMNLDDFAQAIASPDVRDLIASQAGADAIPSAIYQEAVDTILPRLRDAFAAAMADVDVLIYPTTPLTAPLKDHDELVDVGGLLIPAFPAYSLMTRPDSMAGLPSISLAAGLANGLPTGVQLLGKPGSDRHLLAIASAVEAVLPPRPVPPVGV
jgi:indoleacetamide hydrolase